jgi:hypothetical protein
MRHKMLSLLAFFPAVLLRRGLEFEALMALNKKGGSAINLGHL